MSILAKEVFTFVEVARSRSVRGAAERLNISASALSRQLRLMEDDLGVRLFARSSNGVELTEAGERLLLKFGDLIALENEARRELRESSGERELQIRLGLSESISSALTRRLMAFHSAAGLRVRLDVTVGATDLLFGALVDRRLDAVVAFNMPTEERIRVLDDFEVQVGMVCARTFLADPPASISLLECLAWPLCLPGEALSIHPRLMTEINRQGRSYRIATTSNSMATTCGMILDGTGVGFMTYADVIAHPEAGRLHFVPLRDRRLTEHVSFAVASSLNLRGELGAALRPIGRIASEILTGQAGGGRLGTVLDRSDD